MSFGLYAAGWIIFVIGLSLAAHLLHVAPRWIAVVDVILIGLGIMSAVRGTRHRDPS